MLSGDRGAGPDPGSSFRGLSRGAFQPSNRIAEDQFETFYELVAQLLAAPNLGAALTEVLGACLSVMGADGGYIRLFEPPGTESPAEGFPVVVHKGFSEAYITHFNGLAQPVVSSARRSIAAGQRVIVRDLWEDPALSAHRDVVKAERYRSMQATPLMSNSGTRCVGAIFTFFLEICEPSPRSLEVLDLYAELAANSIERHQQVVNLSLKEHLFKITSLQQRESLARLRDTASRLNRRAFSVEPEELRRLAQAMEQEIDRALLGMDLPPEATRETNVDKIGPESPYGLSSREIEVLRLLWEGLSDKQIASGMGITRFTVAKHVRAILRKMDVESRTQAGVKAEREGICA